LAALVAIVLPVAGASAAEVALPEVLLVQPERVELSGPRAVRQLIVTGRYGDGSLRDLTALAGYQVEPAELADVTERGFFRPRQTGSGTLVVRLGPKTVTVPLAVRGPDQPEPVSFRHEVMAVLSVGGCNSGACHGTPNGRNGFKLSLRGYDPPADYTQLTRDVLGRRTDPVGCETSLIWQKAQGLVPHEGGKRFAASSVPAQVLRSWLAQGMPDDPPAAARLESLEVLPGPRTLSGPARQQQLAVLARFSNGQVRDVTRLSVFTSSDESVATVRPDGLVELHKNGEAAILCRYLDRLQSVRFTYLEPKPDLAWRDPPEHNFVDRHVFAKLKVLGLPPSELCSDSAFLRRAYLDVCGMLPPAAEADKFLASPEPDKRAKLIDTLLARPEFAEFWALKWQDVLRSSRRALQPEGAQAYRAWLEKHLAQNTPFDQVVRELLTATGDTFTNAAANYYRIARTPQDLAETTAQLFCGIRMQCAQCHNHPYERWTQDDYYGLAAFFARVKSRPDPASKTAKGPKGGPEIVAVEPQGEVTHPRTGQAVVPRFLGGAAPSLAADQDRRRLLADWLTAPDNPFFARALVNRVWYHLLGRGIVDPVDDFRDSNPPANDELLDALARDFVASGHDVKRLIRTIMNSRTYQLSARSNAYNREDVRYFSRTIPRLLTAEQLLDAIVVVTEAPENFTGMPRGIRAVQLLDGDMNHPFLKAFGQPARTSSCECERAGEGTLARALQMVNGPVVTAKIASRDNRLGRLLEDPKVTDADIVRELYLTAFSRPPAAEEARTALEHVGRSADRRRAWEDVLWALVNTREFLYRP
jgi:hypothetical protein